jgi:hydroxyacylglutathione hydrolase
MVFEQIRVGGDRNFAYLIGDEVAQEAAVVDPAYNPSAVLERVAAHDLKVVYLINTHGHFDHAGGNSHVLEGTKARLIAWGRGGVCDGAQLLLGAVTLTMIHTPGHTSDSICVLVGGAGDPGRLLTGDTLFVGKVGGTDYGAGARTEYESLHRKLMALPDDTEVWPGHDYGVAASSTIGHERRTNPFLLRRTFDEFVHLKKNWLEYKRQHGIA